ncbi:hypothetical protein GN956_G18092 [Arapaima gigas]
MHYSFFLVKVLKVHPAMEDSIKSEEKHVITASVAEESAGALQNGSPQPVKRGRGRPLGSVSKRPKPVKVPGKRGRPRKLVDPSAPVTVTAKKRGRPFKVIKRRGRPRKVPLTPEEEEERKKLKDKPKRPRVWKPLGRPRIYPRVEPAAPPKPRGRGRPRKSESRQGAHLRKKKELSPVEKPPRLPSVDGLPLKRGRPPGSTKVKNKQFSSAAKCESDTEQGETSLPPSKRFCRKSTNVEDESLCSQIQEKTEALKSEMGKSQSRRATRPHSSDQSTSPVGEEGGSRTSSQSKNTGNTVSSNAAEGRAEGETGKAVKKFASRKCVTDKMAASGSGSRDGNLDREKTQRGRRAKKSSVL